jgi:DNA-binding MarR family transcriptional regulator
MSSLRIDTLRLCWLEAFVAVADVDNISQAARDLGVNQTTVSRYLQSLEKWTGKKLLNIGSAHDPEDARVSVGYSEDGLLFYKTAQEVIEKLYSSRTPEARYQEMIDNIETLVGKLEADLKRPKNDVIETIQPNIEFFRKTLNGFDPSTSLEVVDAYRRNLRQFFAGYELRCQDSERANARKAKRSARRK